MGQTVAASLTAEGYETGTEQAGARVSPYRGSVARLGVRDEIQHAIRRERGEEEKNATPEARDPIYDGVAAWEL